MKLFNDEFNPPDRPAWINEAENVLSGLFHYWIKNRPRRPSMHEYLADTEIRNQLTDFRRAILNGERPKG